MDLRLSDILWLVGSAGMFLGEMLHRRSEPDPRMSVVQMVSQVAVALAMANSGRDAAIAGLEDSAHAQFLAATMIGIATLLLLTRRLRAQQTPR